MRKHLIDGMDTHLAKVAAHHDWWSETYDEDYFGNFELYHKVTLENIRRYLPRQKGAIILDAGGGTGIWSIELAQMGYRVVLTDISQGMLNAAMKKVAHLKLEDRVDIRVSNICSMPEFRQNLFSAVLCEGDPLSYCGNYKAAVKEFARVVKPGGAVIASVDNRASAVNWLKEKDSLDAVEHLLETGDAITRREKKEHCYTVHAFTPDELKNLWQSCGLRVERIIGKLVIANRLSSFQSKDPAVGARLLELEIKHNDNPAFLPWAGHLEIVGRKPGRRA